jgi:hypothetical protein
MAKKCFLSFYWKEDSWRVSQVKQIGTIEDQPILDGNAWEQIKRKGDDAVKSWILTNMAGRQCLIVLVGSKTADRRWVRYEMKEAWKKGMGVIAIHVHNLKDQDGNQSTKGSNPFTGLTVDGQKIVGKVYDPPFSTSTNVYNHIKENVEAWVNDAIAARKK